MIENQWHTALKNSKLFKLALQQLKREGKLDILLSNSNVKIYEYDEVEVVLKGLEIIRKANKAGVDI